MGRAFGTGDERPAGEPAIAVVSYAVLAGPPRARSGCYRTNRACQGRRPSPSSVLLQQDSSERKSARRRMYGCRSRCGEIVPGRNFLNSPGTSWLRIVGRLKPGVTVPQAEARLTITFRRMLEDIFGPRMPEDVRREIDESTLKLTPAGQGVSGLRGRFSHSRSSCSWRRSFSCCSSAVRMSQISCSREPRRAAANSICVSRSA